MTDARLSLEVRGGCTEGQVVRNGRELDLVDRAHVQSACVRHGVDDARVRERRELGRGHFVFLVARGHRNGRQT